MKKKRLFSLLVALTLVLVLLPTTVWAQETVTLPEGVDAESFGETNTVYYNGAYYATLTEALTAVYMSAPEKTAEVYCKPGADVGIMTHGHVADDLVIYGNGAYVSGGEKDLEIDTSKYDRTTGKQSNTGSYLDKDITVTVKDLDGIAAWGERHTNYTVNLVFENCDNMQRVYFTNTANPNGVLNISLTGCSFDGNKGSNVNTAFYTNAPGEISLVDTHFIDISVGLNINHKSAGVQNILLDGCTFTDCALSDSPQASSTKTYSAPIRIVAKEGATTNLTVKDVSIVYSEGKTSCGNGDILLGDGRYDAASVQGTVTLAMTNTAATVMVQQAGYYVDASGSTTDDTKAVITELTASDVVLADDDSHFTVDRHDQTTLQGVKEATCTAEGYTGDKVCSICGKVVEQGKVIEKLAHDYKDGVCTVCGAKDPDYKPSSSSPETSDNSNMALWAMLSMSCVGLLCMAAIGKKKGSN